MYESNIVQLSCSVADAFDKTQVPTRKHSHRTQYFLNFSIAIWSGEARGVLDMDMDQATLCALFSVCTNYKVKLSQLRLLRYDFLCTYSAEAFNFERLHFRRLLTPAPGV